MKVQTVAAVVAALSTRLTLAIPTANSEEVIVELRQTDSEKSPLYVTIFQVTKQKTHETQGLTYSKKLA